MQTILVMGRFNLVGVFMYNCDICGGELIMDWPNGSYPPFDR